MIYRWMDLPQQPNFSFTERLFLSGKKRHRFLGHMIMLGKKVAEVFLVLLAMSILIALVWLIGTGASSFGDYLINHHYMTRLQMGMIFVAIFLIVFLVPFVVKEVKIQIKKNHVVMQKTITNKLKKIDE